MPGSLEKYKEGSKAWRPLDAFHQEIGVHSPPWKEHLFRLMLPNAKYSDVYLVDDSRIELVESLKARPYTMGLYYGMLFTDRFVPSLPLAQFLAPRAEDLGVPVARLTREGERYFLYGRIVFEPNFEGWRRGLLLVVDVEGEALGWARGRIIIISGRRVRGLEPIWDLGWYLRRGG